MTRAEAGGHDLRAVVLGLAAWAGALVGFQVPWWILLAATLLGALGLVLRRRRGLPVSTALVWLVAWAGVAASAMLRSGAVSSSVVQELAREDATVRGQVVVTSDPVGRAGRFGDFVVFRARTLEVTGRGVRHRVRAPVTVLATTAWARVRLGSHVEVSGRLHRASTQDLAGVLSTRGPPVVVRGPGVLLRAAERLRASIRAVVAEEPPAPRALVPALVDGDDAGLPADVVEDFRTSGLTHLLAVSGTNLTLVVGCLVLLARWAGIRARGLLVVGMFGVAAFVLLARWEPSVVRAAAMGSVALIGMGAGGRRRGTRALGAAVLVLLVADPWLATSVGFALSVSATAGILWLAPGWRDRMARWLPRWVAEAVSIPLAAQLACTPLVAAISGQVSLVAVAANLLAAPAVGPATVLGIAGGVVGLGWPDLGSWVAVPAAWCARWIIAVAAHGAELPVAALDWWSGPLGLVALTALCVVVGLTLGSVLARRAATVSLSSIAVLVLLVPVPTPGWPPRGWVMVACDVGQGDGLVLRVGDGSAVVVDAGPDPRLIDRCLGRLGISRVPLVVLTHFHADHVDGLEGVLSGTARGCCRGHHARRADRWGPTRHRGGRASRRTRPTSEVRRDPGPRRPAVAGGRPVAPTAPGHRVAAERRQRGAARGDPRPPVAPDGRRGGRLAGTAPPRYRRRARRRAQGGPPRKRAPGPRPRPVDGGAARGDLGGGGQRLRPPGPVVDRSAPRGPDGDRAHRS